MNNAVVETTWYSIRVKVYLRKWWYCGRFGGWDISFTFSLFPVLKGCLCLFFQLLFLFWDKLFSFLDECSIREQLIFVIYIDYCLLSKFILTMNGYVNATPRSTVMKWLIKLSKWQTKRTQDQEDAVINDPIN